MGYCESQKTFRAWDPISRKIIISRDVIFNENIKQDQTKQNSSTDFTTDSTPETTREEPALSPLHDQENEEADENILDTEHQRADEDQDAERSKTEPPEVRSSETSAEIQTNSSDETQPPVSLEKRKRAPPVRWIEESTSRKYAGMASIECDNEEPEDYEKALSSPQAKQWMLAMEEEYASLLKNETWSLVALPPGRKAIKNRWVYKLKMDDNGAV